MPLCLNNLVIKNESLNIYLISNNLHNYYIVLFTSALPLFFLDYFAPFGYAGSFPYLVSFVYLVAFLSLIYFSSLAAFVSLTLTSYLTGIDDAINAVLF